MWATRERNFVSKDNLKEESDVIPAKHLKDNKQSHASNNKDIEKEDTPVNNETKSKPNNTNNRPDKGNKQAQNNNNNNKNTKKNEATGGNKAKIPVKNNMYYQRASPLFIYEINSKSFMANDLLKRAISNAFRHDLNLRPGHLNNADGNCLWEAIIYNILYRACLEKKQKKLTNS